MSDPFWLGGAAASMAACFTHPLDQTKYRMQVLSSRLSMARSMSQFVRRDGISSLWTGLSASVLRQSTYSTTRFALYEYFKSQASPNSRSSAYTTMLCAGAAGGIAGFIGNPSEIILVRMCADGARLPAQRCNYRNPLTGLYRIGTIEGLRTFAQGLGPNVVRSILMNVSQLAAYAESKRILLDMRELKLQDDTTTHILASLAAGTVATTVCAPADVLKSRLQSMPVGDAAQRPTLLRYIAEAVRKEGMRFFVKGWLPAWCRLAPNTVLTFVFMEKLKSVMHHEVNLSRASMLERA